MDQTKRPTIRDVAAAASVSVATVNRVLGGAGTVRQSTMRAHQAGGGADRLLRPGSIRSHIAAARPQHRFGFLLHQPSRPGTATLAEALRAAAASACGLRNPAAHRVPRRSVAAVRRLAACSSLGAECDAVGVVAAVHPLVTEAVEYAEAARRAGLRADLAALGNRRTFTMSGSTTGRSGARLPGRSPTCLQAPGKLGILVGNHRYRCQEMNESGFRSYFREFAPEFTLAGTAVDLRDRAPSRRK